MKNTFCYILFVFLSGAIHGQTRFELDGRSLVIVDEFQPSHQIRSVDTKENTDERIDLFLRYFNPESFETYKQYFLPRDWGGMTLEDFNKWQQYIKSNTLILERIFQVKMDDGKEFLVFQIQFETPEITIPNSLVLKRTGAGWKHISLINDPESDILKKFGELDHAVIHQRSQANSNVSLQVVPQSDLRQADQKFNREAMFSKIETLLVARSIPASDIRIAKEMFLKKDEHGMATFLSELQKTDLYTWMKEINEAAGFALFSILRTRDTQ